MLNITKQEKGDNQMRKKLSIHFFHIIFETLKRIKQTVFLIMLGLLIIWALCLILTYKCRLMGKLLIK